MTNYYNEFDPFAAQWLRNLIAAGLIPDGEIDDRSITEVQPEDLRGFDQCHFFAGIAGWPLALELAGRDGPVWTGSCPCQPFSAAGKQSGGDDERHLWPSWFRLIRECRPDAILGEQVEGAVGFGWLDRVFADLEDEGYATGAAVLGAHSVGAPHIRQRLYWVADSNSHERPTRGQNRNREKESNNRGSSVWRKNRFGFGCDGSTDRLADSGSQRHNGQPIRLCGGEPRQAGAETARRGANGGLGNAEHNGSLAQRKLGKPQEEGRMQQFEGSSPWHSVPILCSDGKIRRVPANEAGEVEPALFPLADGIPNRVGTLRGAGNAICPQTAAEFIKAYMET